MKKKAFITGINGQDGSWLSELLLRKDYKVYGIIRRNSIPEHQESRIHHLENEIETFYGDLLDQSSLLHLLKKIQPDEIYNLAAQSHVRISFDTPQFTVQVNALGTLNLLESYRTVCPKAKFYQASSSEMLGNSVDDDNFQRETTPMLPVSPYGCAKLFSYHMTRIYRNSYGLFASNGILFNHESSRRGSNFVTNKVVKGAVEIKLGIKKSKVELGNLDSYRDWGHSKDYCEAINMILQYHKPDDWVVATGQTRSIRDMCKYVFSKLGMDYRDHIVQNKKYIRPQELKYLRGDSSRIRNTFGWEPKITFESLMDEMIEHWVTYYTNKYKFT